jgi:hypothetical protein
VTTMKRSVTVELGALAIDALGGKQGSPPPAEELARAIHFYLNDSGRPGPGWTYPRFLRDRNTVGVEFDLSLEDSLWNALEEEARTQGISLTQLLEHAALYYAAEVDAGRVTERILGDDLGEP